jgi:hypothetical protein
LPPDSAYEPLTLDDVRYFLGFAVGVFIRRRHARDRALDKIARTRSHQANATGA